MKKITIAQLNTTTGAFSKNFKKITDAINVAKRDGSKDLALSNEALTGHLLQGLADNKDFLDVKDFYEKKVEEIATINDIQIHFVEEKFLFNGFEVQLEKVGGNGEIVFKGGSRILNTNPKQTIISMDKFKEEVKTFDLDSSKKIEDKKMSENDEVWNTMMLGLKDYCSKSGIGKVILGLSGGLDSAIVATIAADALGGENVECIAMPSKYTSDLSNNAAEDLANRQGVNYKVFAIEEIVELSRNQLSQTFGKIEGITDENLQARVRGALTLMSRANQTNSLVLNTGNMSEDSVGYFTIDGGDDIGGYNPIKDLYKTEIKQLCNWRNKNIPTNATNNLINVIPNEIINRAPSAELAEGQEDTDSLPTYDKLDAILQMLERGKKIAEIEEQGYNIEDIKSVFELKRKSQFKREKVAPGAMVKEESVKAKLKQVSASSELPIANGFSVWEILNTKQI